MERKFKINILLTVINIMINFLEMSVRMVRILPKNNLIVLKIRTSGNDKDDLNEDHLIEIDLKEEYKANSLIVDHFLETRIPKLRGIIIKNIDQFYTKKPFEVNMQIFLKDVFPFEVSNLTLISNNQNYKPSFSDKNIKTLCEYLRTKRIRDHLQLEGFEFSKAEFNEIIRNSKKLLIIIIKNNYLKESVAEERKSKEPSLDLTPLLKANRLEELTLTNNGWSEDEEIRELEKQIKSLKKRNEFKLNLRSSREEESY